MIGRGKIGLTRLNGGRLHPYTKFALTFFFSGLSVLLDQPKSLLGLALLSFLLFLSARPKKMVLKIYLFLMVTTVWGLMVGQGLFYQDFPRTVIFCLVPPGKHFSGLCLVKEGLLYGLVQSLRLLAALSAGLFLVSSTPREVLFRAISTFPLPRGLTFMALAAVRFLPAVSRDFELVRQALRLKGYRPFKRGLIYTIKVEALTVYPLLAKAVREAHLLADALLTRGFDPLKPPSRVFLSPWVKKERVLVFILGAVVLAVFTAKVLFWLYLQEIFYAETLRPLYAFVRHFL